MSVSADAGKFITDNTDYGGTAGSLAADVKALVEKIRAPSFRRDGLEFRVARVTMGSMTNGSPMVLEGTTYHQSLYTTAGRACRQ